MKYTKKGHELDQIAIKYKDLLKQPIYILGAGIAGEMVYYSLKWIDCDICFIDNDSKRQRQKYMGCEIISFDEYIIRNDGGIIIIAVSVKNKNIIVRQLEEKGLEYGKDYYFNREFIDEVMPVYAAYYMDKCYFPSTQITVTERCTLRCKHCAHGCNYVENNSKDMTIEEAKRTADIFFSKVDYTPDFAIIGGETLLYKELPKLITYICERYMEKIGVFSIVSNGTIIPNDNLVEVFCKYNILLIVSNYSKSIPRLEKKYEHIRKLAEEKGFPVRLGRPDSNWIDYGFSYVERENNPEELIRVFDNCKTPCRESRGSRQYYCVMARCISENMGYNEGRDDYLDFNELPEGEAVKLIMEFNLGYSEKGYLDMCRRCHGMDAVNYPIPVAEQM